MILKIENIIDKAKENNFIIQKRDIICVMYYLLSTKKIDAYNLAISTETAAIKSIQNKSNIYFKSPKIKYLIAELTPAINEITREFFTNNINNFSDLFNSKVDKIQNIANRNNIENLTDKNEIDFDEAKKMLNNILRNLYATAGSNEDYKLTADLLKTLIDKFSPPKQADDSIVQVEQKYNSVCPSCGKEYAGSK